MSCSISSSVARSRPSFRTELCAARVRQVMSRGVGGQVVSVQGLRPINPNGFGACLTAVGQVHGVTQEEPGTAVDIFNRMTVYYERDGAQPPGAILVELARILKVSTNALLGVSPLRERR